MRAPLDAAVPRDLRRLLRVVGARGELVLAALLAFVSAWGLVAAPWLIGKAVNELRRGSTDHLLEVSLGVAAAGLLAAVTTGVASWLFGRYAIRAGQQIRQLVYERLLSASLDVFRTHPTGQLVARTTADVEPIKLFLTTGVSVFVQLLGTLALALGVMVVIDPALAGIALAPLPLAVLVQLRYSSRTRSATAAAEAARGDVAAQAADDIGGATLLMSLGRAADQRRRFDRAVEALFRRWLRVGRIDAGYGSTLAAIPFVGLGLVLAFGGRAVIDGRISLGEFVTFYAYVGMLAAAAGQINYLTYATANAAASASRIVELLDEPEEITGDGAVPDGLRAGADLRLHDVSVSHEAEAPLRDVTLDVPQGETLVLVGPLGAGMRTVLALANGMLAPDAGTVELARRTLAPRELAVLRALGAPAGAGRLFAMSIADNIAYGRPDASRGEIEAAARLAHVDEVATRLPAGYDTQVGEGGSQLSGGERQRIGLARALLVHRPFLLLDDVTSALDPRAANAVLAGVAEAGADVGATTLLFTFGAAALTLADRIAVFEAGRIVDVGTHPELLERCAEYREMVALWERP